MQAKQITGVVLLGTVLSGPVLAEEAETRRGIVSGASLVSVELAWAAVDDSNFAGDVDDYASLWGVGGRWAAAPNVTFMGGIAFASLGFDSDEIEGRSLFGGVGFLLGSDPDFIPSVSIQAISSRTEFDGETSSDTGFSLSAGAEVVVAPRASLAFGLSYTDIVDDIVSVSTGVNIQALDNVLVGVSAGYDLDNSLESYGVGAAVVF